MVMITVFIGYHRITAHFSQPLHKLYFLENFDGIGIYILDKHKKVGIREQTNFIAK